MTVLLRGMARALVLAAGRGPLALADAWTQIYGELCRSEWSGSPEEQLEAIEQAARVSARDAESIAAEVARPLLAADATVVRQHLGLAPAHIAGLLATVPRPESDAERAAFALRLLPGAARYRAGQAVPSRPGWTFSAFLGAGGQGEVWCVTHDLTGQRQALKLCHDEGARGQLRREAGNLAALEGALGRHPNIVRVYAINVCSTPAWIAMEVVKGGTLAARIDANGAFDEARALRLLLAIARGLSAAHDAGLVHRDLKPANVLLERDGTPKLADFGIGALAAPSLASLATRALTGGGWGTDLYASPEQRQGAAPVPADDVYSLGVILFQMLVGSTRATPPHNLRRAFEAGGRLPTNQALTLIESCLDTRSHRPANARALLPSIELLTRAPARNGPGRVSGAIGCLVALLLVVVPVSWVVRSTSALVRGAGRRGVANEGYWPAARKSLPQTPTGELEIAGFTFLGRSGFTSANDERGPTLSRMAVYRCDRLYTAIRDRLAPGDDAVDTQFVLCPPDGYDARCRIGSPESEPDRDDDEEQRDVQVHPFLIARTELTQRVFDAAGGVAPWACAALDPLNPRETLEWNEAVAFASAVGLRLPSEAEWECAARGGTSTAYWCGSRLPEPASPHDARRNRALRVASPAGMMNAYGLFDTHGNVGEWCSDVDPAAPAARVARGGGRLGHPSSFSRVADRHLTGSRETSPTIGVRLAASLQ